MSAPTLAVGVATYTRHDAHTRRRLDGYRKRRKGDTDQQLLRHALDAEALGGGWVADDIRHILDSEVEWRRVTRPEFGPWWTAATNRQVAP